MSNKNDTPIEELIENLLAERQQMLVLFCTVAGLAPFTHDKPFDKELEEFCEILIDYISVGHFEAYERILSNPSEASAERQEVAQKIYPRILETTDAAMGFNDKYEALNGEAPAHDLEADLTKLISEIVVRIDLEDKLINFLRTKPSIS